MSKTPQVAYLSGGVGGARLLHGLAQILPAERLSAIVNTGDDFEHWGLWISPDVDTVMYTLSGLADESRGWGLHMETFHARSMMERYGAPSWFALGDRDLATHLVRSEALRRGQLLTQVTARLCAANGVGHAILPMADSPRSTQIETDQGLRPFQQWLVAERGSAKVRKVHFHGSDTPTPEVLSAIRNAQLVIIGPSNPYVSIDPILTLRGVREALAPKLVVAVSPIVAGRAIKGPLAHMIESLADRPASAAAVADHYAGLAKGFVIERGDQVEAHGLKVLATDTVMENAQDRNRLAQEVLAFAKGLS